MISKILMSCGATIFVLYILYLAVISITFDLEAIRRFEKFLKIMKKYKKQDPYCEMISKLDVFIGSVLIDTNTSVIIIPFKIKNAHERIMKLYTVCKYVEPILSGSRYLPTMTEDELYELGEMIFKACPVDIKIFWDEFITVIGKNKE